MSIKILATGAGGFILSNFVRFVRQNYSKYTFVAIDNINNSKTIQTLYSNKGVEFYIADVADYKIIDRIFDAERPDYVIHGAVSSTSSDAMIRTNVLGTQSLIEASQKWGVKKIIYLSDANVYGLNASDASEGFQIKPYNTFTASKFSAEILLKSSNISNIILRLTNNIGPRQFVESGFVPNAIANILNNQILTPNDVTKTYSNNLLDWIHVQDTCSAILHVLENSVSNEIFNVSAGISASNFKLINLISEILEKDIKLDAFGDVKNTLSIDGSKLRSVGWKPEWKLDDIVYKTVEWYVKNSYFLK